MEQLEKMKILVQALFDLTLYRMTNLRTKNLTVMDAEDRANQVKQKLEKQT